MTQTQTDNERKSYIKLFDPRVAKLIMLKGYRCIPQKFNRNQLLFAFEKDDELVRFIEEDLCVKVFEKITYIESDKLTF